MTRVYYKKQHTRKVCKCCGTKFWSDFYDTCSYECSETIMTNLIRKELDNRIPSFLSEKEFYSNTNVAKSTIEIPFIAKEK